MKKVDRIQLLLNEDQCCQLSLHLKFVLITLTRSGLGVAQGDDECSLGNKLLISNRKLDLSTIIQIAVSYCFI